MQAQLGRYSERLENQSYEYLNEERTRVKTVINQVIMDLSQLEAQLDTKL